MDKEAQQAIAFGLGILFALLGLGGCWHLADTGEAKKDAVQLQRDIWQAQQKKTP